MSTNNISQLLNDQLVTIDKNIKQLQSERQAIVGARNVLGKIHSSGFGLIRNSGTKKATPSRNTDTKTKTTRKRTTKGNKQMSLPGIRVRRTHNGKPSTMEMVRQVLDSAGTPLSAAEIRQQMQSRYSGIPIADSLTQMLYKRARVGAGFYRDNGKYGLSQWRAKSHAA